MQNDWQLDKADILAWLQESDARKVQELLAMADHVRKDNVGDAVHLRGLLEISNYCVRECGYCGIHASNKHVQRYRMLEAEIIECAQKIANFGYGTVVMQAGEDYGIKAEWLANIIKIIKQETALAVTLSLGERTIDELILWQEAGADRYLLRFETTDLELYRAIHPARNDVEPTYGPDLHPRIEMLKDLRKIGYEIGSGVMIGVPGQTYNILANDILTFAALDLDMIGVGPYIAHGETNLAQNPRQIDQQEQVPNTEALTYKAIALIRLMCPMVNIPSTTALATINAASGRENGLMCGANIVMPNVTPRVYREKYEIYPGKAGIYDNAEQSRLRVQQSIESIGRVMGSGQGSRQKA